MQYAVRYKRFTQLSMAPINKKFLQKDKKLQEKERFPHSHYTSKHSGTTSMPY